MFSVYPPHTPKSPSQNSTTRFPLSSAASASASLLPLFSSPPLISTLPSFQRPHSKPSSHPSLQRPHSDPSSRGPTKITATEPPSYTLMGNHTSSCFAPRGAGPHAILLDPEEPPRLVDVPASAAELMLENPGRVVARAEELRRTRRASGMRADEPLLAGEVYLLLPVDRIGSRLSESQMEVVLRATEKKKKKKKKNPAGRRETRRMISGKRVFPEIAGENVHDKTFVHKAGTGASSGQRRVMHRPWRPVLQTIHESHSSS